jgi:hypothetical protein
MKGKRGERCANLSPSGSGPLVPGLFVVPVVVAERHVDQAFDETFHIFCSQRERERERERQRQRERELNKVEGMAGNVIFVINAFTDKLGRDTCSHGIHNSFELFVKRDSLIVLENIKFRSFISIIVFFFFLIFLLLHYLFSCIIRPALVGLYWVELHHAGAVGAAHSPYPPKYRLLSFV